MRYLCVSCDQRFESDEEKPRCPKCMRLHGIERIDDPKKSASTKPRTGLMIGAVVGVLVALGGAYAFWASREPEIVEGPAPVEPLRPTALAGYLKRDGAPSNAPKIFASDDSVEAFAERATRGKSSDLDKARGVVAALRERASKRGFVTWGLSETRSTALRTPSETLAAISRDGAGDKAYPIELAALTVAALRQVDVPAMLALAYKFEGDRAPTDPSGYLGYFVVAVPKNDNEPREWTYLDVFAGRTTAPLAADVRVLSDVEATGVALAIRGVTELTHLNDPTKAYTDVEAAVHVAPQIAEARTARAVVVITSGNAEEAEREFESAAQLHSDAARLNHLATLDLVRGDATAAARHVAAALEMSPDFAGAHAMLATLHMASNELEEAHRELDIASRLDADLQTLPMLYAKFFAMSGEMGRALEFARKGVERRPNDPQSHLMLAGILRESGNYDEMRNEARAAIAAVPAERQEALRGLIRQMLGPTALEDAPAEGEAAGDEPAADSDPSLGLQLGDAPSLPDAPADLRLGQGSRLLGDDAPTAPAEPSGGPLLRLGDTTKLRLGEPNSGLRLNLQE